MIYLRPVFLWRARAYQGSVLGANFPALNVSEISGEFSTSSRSLSEETFNERVVSHVRRQVVARLKAVGIDAIDSTASMTPFMSIQIQMRDVAETEGADAWGLVARLDLITDGVAVHAGIWVTGSPEMLLPTVLIRDEDTVWTVFVRLLEQPGTGCDGDWLGLEK